MDQYELKKRMKAFASEIFRLFEKLPHTGGARILGGQMLRSGTSPGANYRSACRAKSVPDFISKMGIVEEELDETLYWLELFTDFGFLKASEAEAAMNEGNQLLAIVVASIKTARRNRSTRV